MSAQLWQPVDPATYVSEMTAPLPPLDAVFAAPGYNQPALPKNHLATTAVVLGIVSILIPVLAIAAIICGHIAARDRRRGGAHLVRGALGLGYSILGCWALVLLSLIVTSGW